MNESSRNSLLTAVCGDMPERDRRNLNLANVWMLIWLACFGGATWLIKGGLIAEGVVGWVVAALPTVVATGAILAYGRYLREADELQRKIQLQALALGFGVGLFFGFGYPLFELLGAPTASISDVSVVIAFFYFVGLWLGRRKYA